MSTDDRDDSILAILQENFGEALACTRDWSAWNHGTMSSEDFQSAFEEDGAAQDAVESVKKLIEDAVTDALQKERESLLEWIGDVAVKYREAASWSRVAMVGFAMKEILGDDWEDLCKKIEGFRHS